MGATQVSRTTSLQTLVQGLEDDAARMALYATQLDAVADRLGTAGQAPRWCETTLRGQAARCSEAAAALREAAFQLQQHLTAVHL
ncbi:hypothetical protein [Streptomyces albipurpureus]|uniref:Uncharacterized protein n=1 Tax=Streptomyces albipurpureus TaxID=2897419 RepID=A0ABT0UN01_9ACTN|nr:hypothetical protein [Streptomyces sp. CWNU-1]MCM2389601.1 hypothetical protein [Streptomyces sp. CWNU-1]